MLVRIERITAGLPLGFDVLRIEAEREGFRHMARLQADWDAGAERFDRPGTALFGAFEGDELIGVGGITREPTAPTTTLRRLRRFYVVPESRRHGAGQALVEAVIAHAHGHADLVLVHSSDLAMEFWDRHGFTRVDRPGVTHERSLPAGRAAGVSAGSCGR